MALPSETMPASTAKTVPSLFQRNFAHAMDAQRLSVIQLASETGLDLTLLKRILSGELRPSRSILQRLSVAQSLCLTYKTLVSWCMLDDALKFSATAPFGQQKLL